MATTASLDVLKEQLSASQSYAIAWTCILVWDWLALLPQEARHFWTKKGFAPARIAFFANRYGTLVLQTVSLALTVSDIPNEVCSKLVWLQTSVLVYVLVLCDILLALRVWALLCILLFIETGALISTAAQISAISLPEFVEDYVEYHGCIGGKYTGKSNILPLISVCSPAWTNAILLGMTAYRSFAISRELEGTELPLMKRLVKDGALYFVVITAVDVLNVYFFHQPAEALKGFNTPATIVVSSTVSCRLALSLFTEPPTKTMVEVSVRRDRSRNDGIRTVAHR